MLYAVDGMNVIGSRPDGWWRDRAAARKRLVEEVALLGDQLGTVTVVFDGRPLGDETEQAAAAGVDIAFAPGGPNAADDAIVEKIGASGVPGEIVVVTSDRALIDRVRLLGAQVESAKAFRARLDAAAGR